MFWRIMWNEWWWWWLLAMITVLLVDYVWPPLIWPRMNEYPTHWKWWSWAKRWQVGHQILRKHNSVEPFALKHTHTHTHRDRDIQLDRISDNIQCLSSHCQNRPEKDWNTWWEQTRICWRQTNLTCFHDIRFLANYWQIKSSTMCRNICDDGDQNWGLNDFNSFCFSYFSSTCEFKQQPIGSEYILIVKLIQFRFCRIYNS